jgi:hypothetical protein
MGSYYETALGEGFKQPTRGATPGAGQPCDKGQRTKGEPGTGDTGQLHVVDGPLHGVFADLETGSRTLLRELLACAGQFSPVQGCLVWEVLPRVGKRQLPQVGSAPSGSDLEVDLAYTQKRYRNGRDGNHLMGVLFKCDLCSFRNVVGRDPVEGNERDEYTLVAIQRVLLDVMWAQEPDTVASNWSRSKRDCDMAVNNLSLDHRTILPVLGNPTVADRVGLGIALTTVLASLQPGKHCSHFQLDTIRKTQTWYANAYDAGENFSCETVVGLDQKKQYVSTGHTFGKWFARFMRGARLRMGMV